MTVPLELTQLVSDFDPARGASRPRIMVAGEFSSGKTRLVNALLGEDLLPSAVTSTSLPPIWITHGEGRPECIGTDGRARSFDSVLALVDHVLGGDLEAIHHCRIPHHSPVLLHFDLIDTPGNSDPNIPAACWERIVGHADMILWCSNVVQAWRQSEKSAWLAIPAEVAAQSHLVLSHADRLTDPLDREKVMRRVSHEAEGLFGAIHMASFLSDADTGTLLDALKQAAQNLPSRPSRPFVRVVGEAQDIGAAPDEAVRIAPRRIRVRPVPGRPLLLVPSEAETDPVADDPTPAAEAPDLSPMGVPEADPLTAALDAPDALEDLVKLPLDEFLLRRTPTPQPTAAPAPKDEANDDFLALLRVAIDSADADDPAPPTVALDAAPEAGMPSTVEAEPAPQPMAEPVPEPMAEAVTAPEAPVPLSVADAVGEAAPVPAAAAPQPVFAPQPEVAMAPARPRQPAPAFGPAQMLWARIEPTLDLDDPDSILDGIERLVAELDLGWAQAAMAQGQPVRRRRDARAAGTQD